MADWDTSIFGDAPAAGPAYDPSIFGDDTKKRLPGKPSAEDIAMAKVEMPWSAVPGGMIANLPSSAKHFGEGMLGAVMHPIDTAKGVGNLVMGGLGHAGMANASSEQMHLASAVANEYKKNYGSMEGFKQKLATDPVGVAGDVSTVFGGAGLAAPKASLIGSTLRTASNLTNPLTPVTAAVSKAAPYVGNATAGLLGLTTGTGAEAVKQAAKSGFEGNKSFMENLTSKAPMGDVLDDARNAVQVMHKQKAAEYRSGMLDVSKDKTVLDFANIDTAANTARDIGKFEGKVVNQSVIDKMDDVQNAIREWKIHDPTKYHTPEGMDALKRQVSGILDTIPFENKPARLAVGNVLRSIKGEITAQAPTYAKVMEKYHDSSELITEIERALSLKQTSSADTALRKLQSVLRNNVNANYGHRAELMGELEKAGGKNLMPALAGQAMSTPLPRGLAGNLESLGTLAGTAASANPAWLGLLAPQSPRLVGATAYGAGKASRFVRDKSPVDAEQAKLIALLMSRAGLLSQGQQ